MSGCDNGATCAATQLGFLRISMNPALTNANVTAAEALGLLAGLVSDLGHRYLDSGPAPVDVPRAFA